MNYLIHPIPHAELYTHIPKHRLRIQQVFIPTPFALFKESVDFLLIFEDVDLVRSDATTLVFTNSKRSVFQRGM